MRTEVRLGLAVGGTLFGVVLAYVLFFGNGKHPRNEQAAGPTTQPAGSTATAAGTATESAVAGGEASLQAPAGSTGGALDGGNTSVNITGPGSSTASTGATAGAASPVLPPIVTPSTESTGTPAVGTPATGTDAAAGAGTTDATASTNPPTSATWSWSEALERGTMPARNPGNTSAGSTGGSAATPDSVLPPVGGASADPGAAVIPGTTPSGKGRNYVVKTGETFWTIAKAEYGNGAYFSHLVRANPHVNPNRVRANMTIFIPDKADVVAASTATRIAAGPTTRPFDPATQYRVAAGDSLFRISEKLYGNIEMVEKIYQLNKDLIGPNRAALKLNMVLQLPQPPATTGLAGGPVQ